MRRWSSGARGCDGIADRLAEAGIVANVTGFPGIFFVAFGYAEPAKDYRDLARRDQAGYRAFTQALLSRGVRALERGAWFMSSAHDDDAIDATLAAVADAAREVAPQLRR